MAYDLIRAERFDILRLTSTDAQNRLALQLVKELTAAIEQLATDPKPLILTGNDRFFSSGADLNEVARLSAPEALDFARAGQQLMSAIAKFPAPTIGAISGYCMGGGFDLALSCRWRIASPTAVFAHRGAALGLITGWGGTQRLPRAISRSRALFAFLQAEKLDAYSALRLGLVNEVAHDAIGAALRRAADA